MPISISQCNHSCLACTLLQDRLHHPSPLTTPTFTVCNTCKPLRRLLLMVSSNTLLLTPQKRFMLEHCRFVWKNLLLISSKCTFWGLPGYILFLSRNGNITDAPPAYWQREDVLSKQHIFLGSKNLI